MRTSSNGSNGRSKKWNLTCSKRRRNESSAVSFIILIGVFTGDFKAILAYFIDCSGPLWYDRRIYTNRGAQVT